MENSLMIDLVRCDNNGIALEAFVNLHKSFKLISHFLPRKIIIEDM